MGLRRSYALDAREVERAALPMCQRYHLVTAKIHPLPQNEGPLLADYRLSQDSATNSKQPWASGLYVADR